MKSSKPKGDKMFSKFPTFQKYKYLSFFVLMSSFVAAGVLLYLIFNSSASNGVPEAVSLSKVMSGEEAIKALGPDNLATVAKEHGKSAAALERAFKEDKHLQVDKKGRLLYREAALGAETVAATQTVPANAPLADTFKLHSKAGSKKVIFLDFDGYTLSGTAWNDPTGAGGIVVPDPLPCPAWDIDGSPTTFNDDERTRIQQVWLQVAEDYLAFDVDVTTEDPGDAALNRDGSADEYYGMRTLISPVSKYYGNYGGLSYVGIYDSMNSSLKPAFVFPEMLSNSSKYIGEAASHETGHTFGLFHDGTSSGGEYYSGYGSTETSWAPIMGAGYYRNLTEWSKGEYNLANNNEDDLALIQSHGVAPRADDYPNTISGASLLPTGTTLTAKGITGLNNDVDVIGFSAGSGQLNLTVAPTSLGPDLDIGLELHDSTGKLITEAKPANSLSATINTTLVPGNYYLFIEGTGNGDPLNLGYTNYGSLGQWNLSGTLVAGTGEPNPPADTEPPAAPENLTAVANAYNRVSLSWSPAIDNIAVKGYYILRSLGSSAPTTLNQTTGTTFVDSGVVPQTQYTYSIKAFDAAGNVSAGSANAIATTPSAPDTAAPSTPTNLVAVAVSATQVNLSWNPSADNIGVVNYEVFRNGSTIAYTTTTTFGDSGLISGATYQYYVKAKDAAGNISGASFTTSVTTPTATVTTGNLQGIVTVATSGNPLPGTKVSTVINRKRIYTYTNQQGFYSLGSIKAGGYDFTYALKPYRSQTINVPITAGRTASRNVTLTR
jgi:chitodextrinase